MPPARIIARISEDFPRFSWFFTRKWTRPGPAHVQLSGHRASSVKAIRKSRVLLSDRDETHSTRDAPPHEGASDIEGATMPKGLQIAAVMIAVVATSGATSAYAQGVPLSGEKITVIAQQLPIVAARAGITVQKESLAAAVDARQLVVVAAVSASQKLDGAALAKGAPLSVAYVSSPSKRLPSGYYSLNVAQQRGRGWSASLVSLDGKSSVAIPGNVSVLVSSAEPCRIHIDGMEFACFGSHGFMMRILSSME
jgi:hypothetical protein